MTDQPKSAAAAAAQSRRDRRNFGLLLIDSFGWPLGMSLISMTTILPMFLQTLGASNIIIGLLPAVASLGGSLPQVFIANRVESLPIKKVWVVVVGMAERLPHLLVVPFILLFATKNPSVLVGAFFALWTVSWVSQGFNIPAYFAMMSKVIPPDRRGRLYGYGGAIGGVLGLVGAWGAGLALTRLPFPIGYMVCFGGAFLVLTGSLLPLGWLDEPHCPREEAEPSRQEYLRRCVSLMRSNAGLRRFTLLQVLLSVAGVAAAFFTVHSLRGLHATTAEVALFNGLGLAVMTVGSLLGGPIADGIGHKRVNEWCVALMGASAVAALLAHSVWLMYLAFALYSLAMAGLNISGLMLLLDFAPVTEVATFTAISGTIAAPFRFAAPILAGWLADRVGYSPVFAASAVASALGFVLIIRFMEDHRVVT